ncbi:MULTISPECIES: M15 family metallopeptidase [Bacteroides]|jgi:D-alanyl-D-alanine dipeptidase|uniref:D-alanyl-D-alanine dipeptidase n=1 Tax=Bacteroides ovatus TaxID=28116 RepID=A0A1G6G0N8_BACOV|nr:MULTISPECIES: M15 family metallopeptidase [Bacteroides]SDB75425.1 D-alanyl-D-alanine dipeptidase [Bacteroides ovatus]
MRFIKYSLPILCLLLTECTSVSGHKEKESPAMAEHEYTSSAMALYMDSLGLVDVTEVDSSIAVKLIYTQADNFTGEILYDNLTEAYLHPDAAYALAKAQRNLKELYPSYSLIIYDAARPMSVQKRMWEVVKGTPKYKYVSNPNHGGGLHNYGLAVDISIRDSLGQPLPMGTEVDHLGIKAHITQEDELVRNGKISETEWQNRILLRKVMKDAGFRALPSEWWHFNFCSRDVAKRKYKVIP